ncbi:MAG: DNA gyrase subunit A [Anaerolineaceae bacterium]|jgi:DNA gyrase subunit A|nr:DNA gyrase subunit A [Anaerolineaceae bacterium]MDD4043530.1 DNA gyrase subunit A [Anaerolineaceae bacterium]
MTEEIELPENTEIPQVNLPDAGLQTVGIDNQMRTAYLDYAMSVIVARALPDVRDGLKPVHRRILYAMNDMGIRSNTPFKKSARIVGEVLGKYHPHGDTAVYDSMARMAQDFSMRYMLIQGQGNFGSVDGDSPAAMRYTEARLAKISDELVADLDKDTVDFVDNFDGSLKEPEVLPARVPTLLMNGSNGIAVGMATNIPPHNLRELVSALNLLIDRYDDIEEVSVEELMEHITGPDFPTGGIIVGREGIRQAYSTGRGHLIMRGKATIDEIREGRYAIIINEIPYQLNKTSLIERIAELHREGKIDSISDMRDESDRDGMRIVIELKRGAQPKKVLNQLYKFTSLQSTFAVQLLALVNQEPRMLTLKRALQLYLEHRQVVITRRTLFELDKAKKRAHILDGLLIAIANLDAVIKTIRESPDADVAKTRLIERFNLTDVQAQAILDMQLRRLAALERQKIEDEYKQLMETIKELEDILASPHKILDIIRSDLNEVSEKYGDPRRTRIAPDAEMDLSDESLVQDEPVFISITNRGYIKRVSDSAYRRQGRGGRGVIGQSMRGEDEVNFLVRAGTLDTILFFTDKGKVYSERTFELPEESRQGRGIPLVNIINLEPEETVTAVLAVENFSQAKYCVMATRLGRIKRIPLSDFANVRPSGLIAIRLNDGDELGWVRMTSGKDDLLMVTRQGKALRFNESEVRPTGRTTMGVTGIRLRGDDRVVSMDVVEENGYLLVITDKGQGKRTPLDEYLAKSRGTLGVTTISQEARGEIGDIAQAMVVLESEDITTITRAGIVLRTKVTDISVQGRATQGVRIMDIDEGDSLAAMVRISAEQVESAAKAREQALAEEMESNPPVQLVEEEEGLEEIEPSEGEDEEENSAD